MKQEQRAPEKSRLRIGELLVERGHISREQLQRALEEQRALGGRLGRHLVDLKFLSEPTLQEALSAHMGIPRINLADLSAVSDEAVRYCRADLAEQWGFCPIVYDERRKVLTIAVADPDPQLLRDIEGFLGLKVEPRLAPSRDIEQAIERLYREPLAEETRQMAGLQVSRSEKARRQSSSERLAEHFGGEAPASSAPETRTPTPQQPATLPGVPPAYPGGATPGPHYAGAQPYPQAPQAFLPNQAVPQMGLPVQYPQGQGGYPGMPPHMVSPYSNYFPPPAYPTREMTYAPPSAASQAEQEWNRRTIEQLQARVARLEQTVSAQARALRSLVEVLVDKQLLSKLEMAQKQQQTRPPER